MAAILELIVALVLEPLFALFEFFVRVLVFVLELGVRMIVYLFLWLTQGRAKAGDYFREHKPVLFKPSDSSFPNHTPPGNPIPVRRVPAAYGGVVLLVVLVTVVGVVIHEQIQSYRERQTKQQIRLLVKKLTLAVRDKKPDAQDLSSGLLPEHDAWQRPLEVVVDRWPIGTLVVVRSVGRDGQIGTADDLLAVDGIAPIGVPGFLKNAIKERLPRALQLMDLDSLPIDWVFDDP
jgi:hypothetical protein